MRLSINHRHNIDLFSALFSIRLLSKNWNDYCNMAKLNGFFGNVSPITVELPSRLNAKL